jgi:hypothetical protein
MALGLKGYITFMQHIVTVVDKFPGVPIVFIKLRLLIFKYGLACSAAQPQIIPIRARHKRLCHCFMEMGRCLLKGCLPVIFNRSFQVYLVHLIKLGY